MSVRMPQIIHSVPGQTARRLSLLLLVTPILGLVWLCLAVAPHASGASLQATTAIRVSDAFPIASGEGNQFWPSTGGDYIVYSDCATGTCNIWAYNVKTQQAVQVSSAPSHQYMPVTDGTTVVWADMRASTNQSLFDPTSNVDLYGANLDDLTEFAVSTEAQAQIYPSVSGDTIVWEDSRDATAADDLASKDIYMYSLSKGKESAVSTAPNEQNSPVTNGKVVVWTDWRNVSSKDKYNGDIYGYDLGTKKEFVVTKAKGLQAYPAISGNTVVWVDWRNVTTAHLYNLDIYGYDLVTKKEFAITKSLDCQLNASINGNLVVWTDWRNEADIANGHNSDIYGYDLNSKQEFQIYIGPGTQNYPYVIGNTIVWESNAADDPSQGDYDIMAATISIEVAATPTKPAATPTRAKATATPRPARTTPTKTPIKEPTLEPTNTPVPTDTVVPPTPTTAANPTETPLTRIYVGTMTTTVKEVDYNGNDLGDKTYTPKMQVLVSPPLDGETNPFDLILVRVGVQQGSQVQRGEIELFSALALPAQTIQYWQIQMTDATHFKGTLMQTHEVENLALNFVIVPGQLYPGGDLIPYPYPLAIGSEVSGSFDGQNMHIEIHGTTSTLIQQGERPFNSVLDAVQ